MRAVADDYETVRQEVARRLGEDVLFAWEVKHTLDNLGLYYTTKSVKGRLRPIRVLPKEMGVSSFTHGTAADVSVYPVSKLFAYLKSLEDKGKLNLRGMNAECFQGFVEKGHYTGVIPGYESTAGKRVARKKLVTDITDTNPSSDDIGKIYER